MSLPRRIAFFGGVVAPLALAAIAGVACYDVDGLRGGTRPGVAPEDAAPPAVVEEAGASGFCAQAGDAALFCDDFDQPLDQPFEERWKGLPPSIPGVLLNGDARVERGSGVDISPTSKPYGVAVSLDNPTQGRTSGLLTHSVGKTGARAAEVAVALHASELTSLFVAPTDAGASGVDAGADAGDAAAPDPARPPRVTVLSMGSLGPSTFGASLYLRPNALELRSGIQGSDIETTAAAQVAAFDYQSVLKVGWVTLHIAIGPRELVVQRVTEAVGVAPNCPSTKAVAAAWGSLPISRSACIAMSDALLPLEERDLTLAVGGTMDNPARVRLFYDDALLRALP